MDLDFSVHTLPVLTIGEDSLEQKRLKNSLWTNELTESDKRPR